MQHDGEYADLPVMAVDNVGMEANYRQDCQRGLGEVAEFLNVPMDVAVGFRVGEIVLIVDEIVGNAVQLAGHNADIDITKLAEIHIEMVHILEIIAVLFGNACVVGDNDAHVIFILVEGLGQCAHDIGKTASLNKRHTFRRDK